MNTIGRIILIVTSLLFGAGTLFNFYLLLVNSNWDIAHLAGLEAGIVVYSFVPTLVGYMLVRFNTPKRKKLKEVDEHAIMCDTAKRIKSRQNNK